MDSTMYRKTMLAALAAGMLVGLGPALAAKDKGRAPAKAAKVSSEVVTSVPPPSGQWEAIPPPAQGWVWSAGYFQWKDGRYQWKPGEWVLDKPGMDYRQRQWVQTGDGKWKLIGGDWIPETHAGK